MSRVKGFIAVLAAAQICVAHPLLAAECRMAQVDAQSAEQLDAAYRLALQNCRNAEQPAIRSKGLSSGDQAKGFVPVQVTMTFDRVQFAFDRSDLLPSALPILGKIADFLNLPDNRTMVVSVEGHTDAIGTDEYNMRLSERRAAAVRDFLVTQRAVEPLRVDPRGWGRQHPLAGLDPEHPDNRRVEFIVQ